MSTELYEECLEREESPDDDIEIARQIGVANLRNNPELIHANVEHLLKHIRNSEANEAKLSEEIKRLQGRRAVVERAIEYRRGLLKSLMDYVEQTSVKTPLGTAYFIAARKSLQIDTNQVAQWPDNIQSDTNIVSYEVKVNKLELKGRYPKAYATLPGVEETEGERALAIKW